MKTPKTMLPEVFDALNQIEQKNISDRLYGIVSKNEKNFLEIGITLEEITDLLDMKQGAEDFPDFNSYNVTDEWRANYIYENLANPEIKLRGDNERSFLAAVRRCDSIRINYEQEADKLSRTVTNAFAEMMKQEKNLEKEGVRSWKGIRYQYDKVMTKLRGALLGTNRTEADEVYETKVGQNGSVDRDRQNPDAATSPAVTGQKVPPQTANLVDPENTVDRKVMAENYRLWTLTEEQKLASDGVTVLYRIQANKTISSVFGIDVLKGDLGGWIENEKNLEGNSWVGDNAEVYGQAKVVDSVVLENAIVNEGARVTNDSCVAGNALVTLGAEIDNSIITDNAQIESATVINSSVDGYSTLVGTARMRNCTCAVNTHIVNAEVCNMDMSGDIHIEDTELGHGVTLAERGCVEYIRPALLTDELLKKLRIRQQEGLTEEVVCGGYGTELIADLKLVKGRCLTMDLAVGNPVICHNGVNYDGQKVVNKLDELGYRVQDIPPEHMAAMLNGIPKQLGPLTCIIRQEGEEFVVQNITAQVSASKKHQSDVKLKNLFVFTGEQKIASNHVTVLHRIKANRDLTCIEANDVPEGTLGGWIEKEDNLSGYSWVGSNAEVYGDARVVNSVILGNSIVRDEALVKESTVWGNSVIEDDAAVKNSLVSGRAQISGFSILENSVFAGYGVVAGRSHLENCFCRNNVNVINSSLRYVSMEGDFLINGHELDCKTEGELMKPFGYTPPVLISRDVLEKLRAYPKEGLKCMTLVNADGRELIADLKLVAGKDMKLKLDISHPIIWHDGVNYNGQKLLDGLNKQGCDITGMKPSQLSRIIAGEPMRIRSVLYAAQQKGEDYELVDLRKRVGNIEIYPNKVGEMSIRCTIDGVQQGARMLTRENSLFNMEDVDTKNLNKTDRKNLAVNCFLDELRGSRDVVHSMSR